MKNTEKASVGKSAVSAVAVTDQNFKAPACTLSQDTTDALSNSMKPARGQTFSVKLHTQGFDALMLDFTGVQQQSFVSENLRQQRETVGNSLVGTCHHTQIVNIHEMLHAWSIWGRVHCWPTSVVDGLRIAECWQLMMRSPMRCAKYSGQVNRRQSEPGIGYTMSRAWSFRPHRTEPASPTCLASTGIKQKCLDNQRGCFIRWKQSFTSESPANMPNCSWLSSPSSTSIFAKVSAVENET